MSSIKDANARLATLARHVTAGASRSTRQGPSSNSIDGAVSDHMPMALLPSDTLPTVFFLQDHMEGCMPQEAVMEAFKRHDLNAS